MRIRIYAKDIEIIEGCSCRTAYRRLGYLKDVLNVRAVSIYKYCEYMGFELEEVKRNLYL